MRVFLRHGHKEYTNDVDRRLGLDPGLNQFGDWTASIQFEALFKVYPPDMIVTSPFCRTRQTANIAQLIVHKFTGNIIPIYVDVNLGEYLARYKYSGETILTRELLSKTTLSYGPIFPESKSQHKQRLRKLASQVLVNNAPSQQTTFQTVETSKLPSRGLLNEPNNLTDMFDQTLHNQEKFSIMQPWDPSYIKPEINIWFITHGLNILRLGLILGFSECYPEELGGLAAYPDGRVVKFDHVLHT